MNDSRGAPFRRGTGNAACRIPGIRACFVALLSMSAWTGHGWCAETASTAGSAPPSRALATQSWRCASPGGGVTYSQQPCAGGSGALMHLRDERTTGQVHQAKDNLERDGKLARRLQRQRLQAEKKARDDRAVSLSGTGKPHQAGHTPNTHDPVPIDESTKPIRLRHKYKAQQPAPRQPAGHATMQH